MGYYRILSTPIEEHAPRGYRGAYRCEVGFDARFDGGTVALWYRYVEYLAGDERGIVDELSMGELRALAARAEKLTGVAHEIVYFGEGEPAWPVAVFYGIDVCGHGGYSLVGEGASLLGVSFADRLNEYGLFSSMEDAQGLEAVLRALQRFVPGLVEGEEWIATPIWGIG